MLEDFSYPLQSHLISHINLDEVLEAVAFDFDCTSYIYMHKKGHQKISLFLRWYMNKGLLKNIFL